MTGSVKRDGARGPWYFVVDVASPDGQRRQLRRRGFPTKKAAEAALAEVVTEQNRGTFVRPTRRTIGVYLLDDWLPARRKLGSLKPSTLDSYDQLIRAYVVPNIGAMTLASLDGATLTALYGELLTTGRRGRSGAAGTPLAAKTVRNLHGVLHRALKDAVKWRLIASNPADAAEQPGKRTPEQQAWTAADLGRFVEASRADRCGALWHLLATTGMRRGELLGLRWQDVDLEARSVTVRQTMTMVAGRPAVGTPKSEAGVRQIKLDPDTVAALRAWRKQQNADRLLMGSGWAETGGLLATEADGTSIHPQVLSRRFRSIVAAAGLPAIRFHDVRHSYATAALAAGVPVKTLSKRLGHADIKVTLSIYAHVMPGDDEAAADLVAAHIRRKL
jgi:integrase